MTLSPHHLPLTGLQLDGLAVRKQCSEESEGANCISYDEH